MSEASSPATATSEWLDALLRERCNIQVVRDFQLTHGLDLVNGKDLFLVVGPGHGKTVVLLAPMLAAQARGRAGIWLMIVPTKVLAEQHVRKLSPHVS